MTTTPISEYAVLGDGRSAALVSRSGSVDWLCLPDFDSPACFAALLGAPEHGRWLLTVPGATSIEREYDGDSFVLRTTYRSATGVARVTDAMPTADGRADLIRRLEVLEGEVQVEHEWVVRFGYGKITPWVSREADDDASPYGHEALRAVAGPDSLMLRGTRLPTSDPRAARHRDTFTATAGESFDLTLTWSRSWMPVPEPLEVAGRLDRTVHQWEGWADGAQYDGPHREAVTRSLLVLRLLTHSATGGIVAAATTSLPEDFGGERNWDYRFSWLRDAAMTVEALLASGFRDEIAAWREWLLRAIAGDPADLQIMYGIDGRRDLPERELDHLPGYAASRPVRIGNAAVSQVQNDVLGEVMCALDVARDAGLPETPNSWSVQRHLLDDLVEHWRRPDRGIWEVRGPERAFVHSRVMSWAALDRGIRAVEVHGNDGPVDVWRTTRDEIHAEVLERGWDPELGSFVQYYGAQHVDAALLQMFQVGFLPADDERMRATVRRIQSDLGVEGGLIMRYSTTDTTDGLRGDEHPFLVCCFWLVDALARMDEVDEAVELFDRLIGTMNDVGLMAEEFDPAAGVMAGNFPQAFSHLGLIQAAHSLAAHSGGTRT